MVEFKAMHSCELGTLNPCCAGDVFPFRKMTAQFNKLIFGQVFPYDEFKPAKAVTGVIVIDDAPMIGKDFYSPFCVLHPDHSAII